MALISCVGVCVCTHFSVLDRRKRRSARNLTPVTFTANPAYTISASSSNPPKASASATGAVQTGSQEDYEEMEYQE